MNTPLREAIQREIRLREARRATNAGEKPPESSPKQELHGKARGAASRGLFQGESASAPQGQGFPEKAGGASGNPWLRLEEVSEPKGKEEWGGG